MSSEYEIAEKFLTSQDKFYINLGLERISSVLNCFGNPQNKIKIIHVAGTNGKGSVCAMLSNILKVSGYKTGLYTSPHLVKYNERIKINGEDISDADFSKYVSEISETANKTGNDLTEFEILTAAAYKYFYDNGTDVVVAETGLGGRYDATNIVNKPLLCIITSISLDHTDRLGDTIDKIAFEKAGIIKPGSPVVVASDNSGFDVIKKYAEEKKSEILVPVYDINNEFKNGKNILSINSSDIEFPLTGKFQEENCALVLKAVEYLRRNGFKITEKETETGLKTVKWCARQEYISSLNLLIDGAHNPAGAIALKNTLSEYFKNKKKIFIYSTLKTKDYKKIADILFDDEDEIYFFSFNHKDAVNFAEYKQNLPRLKNLKEFSLKNFAGLFERNELKIITGSLYMTGILYPFINKKKVA